MKFIYFLLCSLLFLTSCSLPGENNVSQDGDYTVVGKNLRIKNDNKELVLLDNKNTLEADGLYYATWTIGTPESYKNSDGDTVDLYDAQLYLLSSETKSSEKAQQDIDSWIAAARTNYDITDEKTDIFNGEEYFITTYNCKGDNNPYSNGVSAFGVSENNAVCIELTCRQNFNKDLMPILTRFLNNCYYNNAAK